jgi:hypothetical protein
MEKMISKLDADSMYKTGNKIKFNRAFFTITG